MYVLIGNIVFIIVAIIFMRWIFDISSGGFFPNIALIYSAGIVLVPVAYTVTNVGLLYFFSDISAWFGLLPLLIPVGFFLHYHISSFFHKIQWEKIQKVRPEVHSLLRMNVPMIEEDDIFVRLPSFMKINLLINTYSDEEERDVKALRKEIEDVVKKFHPRMDVHVMIDKKRESRSSTIV